MQKKTPMVLVVCACKSDLLPVPRMEEEAKKLAAQYDAMYMETSAKQNRSVSELFLSTAAKVLEWHEAAVQGQARPLPVTVGGLARGDRLSPMTQTPSTKSTGFQKPLASRRSFGEDPVVMMKNSTNPKDSGGANDQDSCTENESDEVVMEEAPSDAFQSEPGGPGPVTCEGSYLVCGVEDASRSCVIL